jgi:conjugative transfer region protein (TIGR03750 family)
MEAAAMPSHQDGAREGLVTFLPHRLNRQPIVVRGLTADELWFCAGLSATAGLVIGLALAWLLNSIAMAPTVIVAAIALGVYFGGGRLRSKKRGRPDTWLYRYIQWRVTVRVPSIGTHIGGGQLVTRSGFWATRRSGEGD